MGRDWGHGVLAGIGMAIMLAGLPSPARADADIHARGWTHQSYGRLVLDDAARVTSSVEIRGHTLVIAFSEPVSIDFGSALYKLTIDGETGAAPPGRADDFAWKAPHGDIDAEGAKKSVVDGIVVLPAAARP